MSFTKNRKPATDLSLTQLQSLIVRDLSTQGEDSPRNNTDQKNYRSNQKEKLQLCRKFSEFGYCPYNNKCKFAHGSHELRKNNSTNSKYKTKQCSTFYKQASCHYGSRCNFLHSQKGELFEMKKRAKINYRDIFLEIGNESKLIKQL